MAPISYIKKFGNKARKRLKVICGNRPVKNKAKIDFVCFGITDDCMLACKMCRKWQGDIFTAAKHTVPEVWDWKRAISSLRTISDKGLQINFGGGEPLLKKDILDLVSFSKKKGFLTNIATNAYLIDRDMAKRIAHSGLDSIIISLDSLVEDTHDYLRGVRGVYRQVLNAIELLDKHCNSLFKGICCVIYEKNIDDILSLAEWAFKDRRINSIYFMAAMQPNNTALDSIWYKKDEHAVLWPKDRNKVNSVIDELIKIKKVNPKITNQISQLKAFKSYYNDPSSFVKNSVCNMGSALHISSIGDIFICYRWESLGNIIGDDIAQLWNSDKAYKVRNDVVSCQENCHFLLNCFFKEEAKVLKGIS
jgi:MoaA/NifB/PqqE/SkfB family radical SAM enzyme